MSDYWDAVSRAVLGLPGSAKPRPRSIYESEEPLAPPDDFETVEQEMPAAPIGPTPAAAALPAPSPQPIAGQPAQEPPTAQSPDPQPTQLIAATRERVDARMEVPASPTDPSATHDDDGKQVLPPPPQSTARVDVRRIETTQTMIERVEARTPQRVEDSAWQPIAQEAAPQRQIAAEPSPASAIEPPLVIVAEPLAPVPAPARQQPAPDPPPLVIEIGRIDIRIASETVAPPTALPRRDPGTVPSLNDYLARRSEAKR